mmetsp:Transcript_39832/g.94466  ORF Transcript_39832/g.94466 Transcript_39832/m.94466 type:complete len:241 (-) Transcript_39832:3061-3783(-)
MCSSLASAVTSLPSPSAGRPSRQPFSIAIAFSDTWTAPRVDAAEAMERASKRTVSRQPLSFLSSIVRAFHSCTRITSPPSPKEDESVSVERGVWQRDPRRELSADIIGLDPAESLCHCSAAACKASTTLRIDSCELVMNVPSTSRRSASLPSVRVSAVSRSKGSEDTGSITISASHLARYFSTSSLSPTFIESSAASFRNQMARLHCGTSISASDMPFAASSKWCARVACETSEAESLAR